MEEKTVAVIGGGIVGVTAAYYLQRAGQPTLLFDEGVGQATKASAGIICPWFSQRRNADWYQLVADGARFYRQLMADLTQDGVSHLPFSACGALVFKKKRSLVNQLYDKAIERRKSDPTMGDLAILTPEEVSEQIQGFKTAYHALYASGGGKVDGEHLVALLTKQFQAKGGQFIPKQVRILHHDQTGVTIASETQSWKVSQVIVAAGAWLGDVLAPLNRHVAIRPQKGQLIVCSSPADTDQWPVLMLVGETDIIPHSGGQLIIGASHENDKGYDLTMDQTISQGFISEGKSYFPDLYLEKTSERVGTRAYTPDFLPLYGDYPYCDKIQVASGLGSSGLTSGPIIGYRLAQRLLGHPTPIPEAFNPNKYIS